MAHLFTELLLSYMFLTCQLQGIFSTFFDRPASQVLVSGRSVPERQMMFLLLEWRRGNDNQEKGHLGAVI